MSQSNRSGPTAQVPAITLDKRREIIWEALRLLPDYAERLSNPGPDVHKRATRDLLDAAAKSVGATLPNEPKRSGIRPDVFIEIMGIGGRLNQEQLIKHAEARREDPRSTGTMGGGCK
jgi:hypothetical protein